MHRDLKSANILLARDGGACIAVRLEVFLCLGLSNCWHAVLVAGRAFAKNLVSVSDHLCAWQDVGMARMLTQNVLTSLHGTFGAASPAPPTCPNQAVCPGAESAVGACIARHQHLDGGYCETDAL